MATPFTYLLKVGFMNEATLELLTWLIPVGPLLAFFLIVLFTKHNRTLSWMLSWVAIFASLIMGWTVAFSLIAEDVHHLAEHPVHIASSVTWLPFLRTADTWLRMGVAVDPLTAVMLIMVPFACTAIFMYSVGYHNYGMPRGSVRGVPNHGQEEPMFSRFFAYICLFAGAMLTLVVADNLLLLFVGWEVMGLCSYLLIGFWYARNYPDPKAITPRKAAIKAFMTTRIGDVIMLLGIVFFYRAFGTLNFSEAFHAEHLAHLAPGAAGAIALLLFAGTVGKSAQWPLHVWLPDAMEGPTPVSAMIHAATMVSAGVYLIVRIFPLIAVGIEQTPGVGMIIAGIGAFTALMAACIAVAQNDVKRVLAYSTISQLGFMVAAIGIGGYVAAAFHLITHAFFKALLFLGSGSIIHGMEHGDLHLHHAHDDHGHGTEHGEEHGGEEGDEHKAHGFDPQDMMNMGGLAKKMPLTFWTFLIGGMALSGLPFVTAGFWSKDEIFAEAFYQGTHGNPMGLVVFIVLAIAAFLTAFYTTRQIALVFFGQPRTDQAEHAHESTWFMTVPLLALSVFAIAAGWAGIPENFPVIGPLVNNNFFHHFVGATIEHTFVELNELGIHVHEIETLPFSPVPLIVSLVVALGGILLGWLVYGRNPLRTHQADPAVRTLTPFVHTALANRLYWDELYQRLFIRPVVNFSEAIYAPIIDKGIIDGTLHLIARTTYAIGWQMRRFEEVVVSNGVDAVKDFVLGLARDFRTIQTGKIQEYALVSLFIAWALTAVVLLINSGLLDSIF
jgi:NADH-quinone oxidoreductase subunit L